MLITVDLTLIAPGVTVDKSGVVSIGGWFSARRLAAEHFFSSKPKGTELIRRLVNSPYVVAITTGIEQSNWEMPAQVAPRPISLVHYNPRRYRGGFINRLGAFVWTRRPPFIGLAHELIHALHLIEGTSSPTMIPYFGRRIAEEELNTVGCYFNGKSYGEGDITENDVRRENGLPLRVRY